MTKALTGSRQDRSERHRDSLTPVSPESTKQSRGRSTDRPDSLRPADAGSSPINLSVTAVRSRRRAELKTRRFTRPRGERERRGAGCGKLDVGGGEIRSVKRWWRMPDDPGDRFLATGAGASQSLDLKESQVRRGATKSAKRGAGPISAHAGDRRWLPPRTLPPRDTGSTPGAGNPACGCDPPAETARTSRVRGLPGYAPA